MIKTTATIPHVIPTATPVLLLLVDCGGSSVDTLFVVTFVGVVVVVGVLLLVDLVVGRSDVLRSDDIVDIPLGSCDTVVMVELEKLVVTK